MKIKLLLSYEGTEFKGWQKQKNARTVQGELEKSLSQLLNKKTLVTGAGRTDAGTHALGQVAHFEGKLPQNSQFNLVRALNHLSPKDISIRQAWSVPKQFHARFSAVKKTYQYFILEEKTPSPLARNLTWSYPCKIQLKNLQTQARFLEGKKDFFSFQSRGSSVKTTERTLFKASWEQIKHNLYQFTVIGDGFLKQMVRNLVGTQIQLMNEEHSATLLEDLFKKNTRTKALPPAPAGGLYLKEICYPPELDRLQQKL